MFLNDVDEIPAIAARCGCAIFGVPAGIEVTLPRAHLLQPQEKSIITIDQVRATLSHLTTKQFEDQFILIRPAEQLGEPAANALLKTLEEPSSRLHFVLVTPTPEALLPTIRSRAAVYYLRQPLSLSAPLTADEPIKALARQLVAATPANLPALAIELTRKKDGARAYALTVLSAAIEILYKSYFKTTNPAFLSRLPKFLAAYTAIASNGQIKLQLVANLC